MQHIESLQNQKIKTLVQLQKKSKSRQEQNVFIVEGQREIELAKNAGYHIKQVFICKDIYGQPTHFPSAEIFTISEKIYQKIAYRSSTEGIVAIIESPSHQLDQLQFKHKNPLILVAEAPEKPGNIGALLRTADAANCDAVIIANPTTDLYNPNIIRSSVGTLFTQQIATGSTTEIIKFLKEKQISIYAATLQNANSYLEVDYNKASAFVVGTEADGLSQEWRDLATQNIIIPMHGKIDSMNVSVSAAILIFEAVRQRQIK
ncbi:MAG: RNA methyltransferase [Psychroflexus sp.]|nr:RNA methyltransferase [Psychroflexus sp.]